MKTTLLLALLVISSSANANEQLMSEYLVNVAEVPTCRYGHIRCIDSQPYQECGLLKRCIPLTPPDRFDYVHCDCK